MLPWGIGLIDIASRLWTAEGIAGRFFSIVGGILEEKSLSTDARDARVILSVPIRGAFELESLESPESLLPKNFHDELASIDDNLPRSLRHDDSPSLLPNILKLEFVPVCDEKCLRNLCTSGMHPTMMPIDISANLDIVSTVSTDRYELYSRPETLSVERQLIFYAALITVQSNAVDKAYDTRNAGQ